MSYINDLHRYFYHYIYRTTQLDRFRKYGNKYFHSKRGQKNRKEYLKKHPWEPKEHYKIAKKKWHDANKSRRYKEYKVWAFKNRKRLSKKSRLNWLKIKEIGGNLSKKLSNRAYENNIEKYGELTCYLCLEKLKSKKHSIDHKVPISKGGRHRLSNLGIACLNCNIAKKDRTVKQYKKYLRLIKNANIIQR